MPAYLVGRQFGAHHMSGQMDRKEVLKQKLAVLQSEHRDLDTAISAIEEQAFPDQLAIKRLKKRKLALKDEIARIEDDLTPDIIA